MTIVEVKLLDSDVTIRRKILREMTVQLNKAFEIVQPKLTENIRVVVEFLIRENPTVKKILSGDKLLGELGIPSEETRFGDIISLLKQQVEVKRVKARVVGGTRIQGGLKILAIKSDYTEILSSPAASFLTKKGVIIPYLEWLLTQGVRILVRDYVVMFGPFKGSRTGLALMRKQEGSGFRIEPPDAGTINNNFITRIIATIPDSILENLLDKRLSEVLNRAS